MQPEVDTPRVHPIDRFIADRRVSDPKFSKQAFAALVGVSRNAIYRVIHGDDAVSTDLLEKIEKATGGAIGAVELFAAWKAARAHRTPATA